MKVRVHRGAGALQQIVEIGPHRLLADEPVEVGGADSGPAPHDFLATALATCTAMTVLMYARRKEIALDDVDVQVEHERTPDGYALHRRIQYIGALSDGDRLRLTEIANKCPVHRTLSGTIRIDTEAA
jgi:putative redox protein